MWCYVLIQFFSAIPNASIRTQNHSHIRSQLIAWQAVSSEVPPAWSMGADGSQVDRTGWFKRDPHDPTWQIHIKTTFCK